MSFFPKVFKKFTEGWKQRKVVLYERDYQDIKNGDGGHSGIPHPEIETHFRHLIEAVEEPDQVNQDAKHKSKECYYRFPNTNDVLALLMRVVIKKHHVEN